MLREKNYLLELMVTMKTERLDFFLNGIEKNNQLNNNIIMYYYFYILITTIKLNQSLPRSNN